MQKLFFNYYSADRFPMAVQYYYIEEGDHDYHTHDFTELVIVVSGNGTHLTRNGEYQVSAGDVFILREGEYHGYKDTHKLQVANIIFKLDDVWLVQYDIKQIPGIHSLLRLEKESEKAASRTNYHRLSPVLMKKIQPTLARLQQELKQQEYGYMAFSVSLFTELIIMIARSASVVDEGVAFDSSRLGQVLSYIERNYRDEVIVEDLAKTAKMSTRSFSRHFKDTMGTSPINYLLEFRIRKAKLLLTDPELSVAEIALMVGFTDSNYFSRQFRKIIGYSPRQYRTSLLDAMERVSD